MVNCLVTRLFLYVTRQFTNNLTNAIHGLGNSLLNSLVTRFTQPIESPSKLLNNLMNGLLTLIDRCSARTPDPRSCRYRVRHYSLTLHAHSGTYQAAHRQQ